jgi:pyochelin biosynthetic protein PchC
MLLPHAADWLRCYRPRPGATVRLICFPFACGSAIFFRPWVDALPDTVELVAVQYPGRLDRFAEPAVADMDTMVKSVMWVLPGLLDRPVAMFGHSMGAAIAFEVARALQERHQFTLRRLFVSGRPPPGHHRPERKHLEPDDVLWDELRRLGGTTADAMAHEGLRATLLPAMRGDYRLIETYRPVPGGVLDSPVTALLGDQDPEVTVAEARGWAAHTSTGFRLRVFPGHHFYIASQPDAVVAEVVAGLAPDGRDDAP